VLNIFEKKKPRTLSMDLDSLIKVIVSYAIH